MAYQPPDSEESSYPYTSSSSPRPVTSYTSSSAGEFYNHHGPQYTFSEGAIEEEDESEDEDVFAYVPPSTAEQQAQQQQAEAQVQLHQQILAEQPRHTPPPSIPDTTAEPIPAAPLPAYQPASYDPGSPYPPISPSVYERAFQPVETPPSTASQHETDDGFRMRRITGQPPATPNGTTPNRPSISVRSARNSKVKIELPTQEDADEKYDLEEGSSSTRGYFKDRPLSGDSGTGSISVTPSMLEYMEGESREGSIKMGFDLDAIDEEDSPYPEVRASVSNIDDPEMPALTVRMWIIGLSLSIVGGALNVFFNFRAPAPTVVPLVLLLISYPIGKALAFSLPIKVYRLPKWLGGVEFSLNPGPWNIKEHVLVYIMANVAVGPPYALNAIVVSQVFYHIELSFWFNLVLVLATQLTGFGLAGLCRRFLVWPASMVWPQNLVACTLLNTLHAEDDEEGGGVSRYKYYMILTFAAFAFWFLPGFLFLALSVFSWVCWISPKNVVINQVFGVNSGMGMSVLTFDWNQISWIGSPLMIPWWAEVHIFAGFILFYWILVPVLYYTNVWDLAYFPMSDDVPYDRFGKVYDVSQVLKSDFTFNVTAYEEYSPLYLPATYAMTYLLAFTLSTCVLVHTVLYHGKSLLNGFKKIRVEKDDIHAKLMRNYPEVPDWWYLVVFCVFFALAIVAAEVWHTGVPVWALLLAVCLPVLYVLPSGLIYAMTGQGVSLNLLAQILPGTLLPGQPLANMVFKAYSVQTLTEATSFVQDLKLGHYIKVPPRATFIVQLTATLLTAWVQVGVKQWMFSNIPDICQDGQRSQLTCPHNQVFFTASVIWGLIGPTRQFGAGTMYNPQLYAMIIGAFLPLPFWLWQRRRPNSFAKYVSTPVLLNGVSFIPPATGINYSSWFLVGFIFQYLIRRRNFAWWSKFNYVTSAALDSGTVISVIVVFFALQFPKGGVNVNWWGNTVFENTADWNRTALRSIPTEGLPFQD